MFDGNPDRLRVRNPAIPSPPSVRQDCLRELTAKHRRTREPRVWKADACRCNQRQLQTGITASDLHDLVFRFMFPEPSRLAGGTPSSAFLELSATLAIGAPNAAIASRLLGFHFTSVGVVPWRPSRLQEIPAIRLVGDPCTVSSGAEGISPQQDTDNLKVPLPPRCAEGRQLDMLDRSRQCPELRRQSAPC